MKDINIIFKLENDEKEWWKALIKKTRSSTILSPQEYIKKYLRKNAIAFDKKQISQYILDLRSGAWDIYLYDESLFHIEIFKLLMQKRVHISSILEKILQNNKSLKLEELELLQNSFGEFAGSIMPYIYEVSLSTTNSRRSRAGSTFESIINHLMNIYDYPYIEQSSLGNDFYKKNNLGKLVDGILPSAEFYLKNRAKCCVISAKTSLRERWQEVVEEINRTNLSLLYLLTLDPNISKSTFKQMKQHNIVVVNLSDNCHRDMPNNISFEIFFNTEIPHFKLYWDNQ